jgi:hypothetical protein
VTKTKETQRLDRLKDESRNIAKTYKLPLAAVKLIEKAGKIHGQQSRAIQVAVELLRHNAEVGDISDGDLRVIVSTQTSKTYKLTPRTIELISGLTPSFGMLGNVMAAIAVTLNRIERVDTRPRDTGSGPMTAEYRRQAHKALKGTFGPVNSE